MATPQGGGAGATPPLTGFDLPGQVAGVQGAAPPAGCGAAPRPKRYNLVKTKRGSNDLRGIGSSDLTVAT